MLLKKAGVAFRVIPSHVAEDSQETRPRRLVLELALRKAVSVARRYPKDLVLGADTIVFCRGEIITKPKNRRDAERILRLLSGSWQRIYTGIALAWEGGNKTLKDAVATRALARKLPEDKLLGLIGKHMDKAGAYAVQDKEDPFIARIIGPRDNVIGLPVAAVKRLMRRAAGTRSMGLRARRP